MSPDNFSAWNRSTVRGELVIKPSDALRDTIDRVAMTDYHNEDYESCLRRCSALLFDGGQSLDGA